MKEITNEFLAACFAAYWGSNVSTKGGKQVKLVAIGDAPTIAWDEQDGKKWGESRYEWLRLHLTHLSAITDEDAVEVAKIADKNAEYFKGNNHRVKTMEYKCVRTTQGDKVYIGIDRFGDGKYFGYEPLPTIATLYSIEQIDYLRSSKRPDGTSKPVYDCGYMHIPSLIDAGIAIDATTI